MEPHQTYYWRVDTVLESEVLSGEVWRFTRSPQRALLIEKSSFEEALVNARELPGWSVRGTGKMGLSSEGVDEGQYLYLTPGCWVEQEIDYELQGGND